MTTQSSFDRVNILLVDDQPAKLLSYEIILKDLGENLIKASSAREAFSFLLKNDVAVLLVDVSMPELDGFQLVSMLREHPRFQNTPVIFISAIHLSELDLVKGYKTGAVDYVSVPVVPEILRSKVKIFADLYRKTHQLEQLNNELEQRVLERTNKLEESTARLRESEERLRLASEAAEFGTYDYNMATGHIYCSPRLKSLLGTDASGELDFETFLSLVHPADRDAVRAGMTDRSGDGDRHELEFRTILPGGGIRWLLDRGCTFYVKAGEETYVHVMGTVIDITSRKEAEERQNLLMAELDHRVKNILANISAIANLSGRTATSVDAFVKSLDGRIHAMSRAHSLLRRNNWIGADLSELVSHVLDPLRSGKGDNIKIEGKPVKLGSRASQSVALIIYELATNAAKYGALSVPGGQVTVSWTRLPESANRLQLSWTERGGPPVRKPETTGFGLTAIQTAAAELDASVDCRFYREGVQYVFEGPFEQPTQEIAPAQPAVKLDTIFTANAKPSSQSRILIVEDEPLVALQLKLQLEEAGHVVVGPARNLAEGMELANKEAMDAALLDITLGRDISTPIADALLRKGVPFAFSTGYGDSSILPDHLQKIPCITKPYAQSKLSALIDRLVNARATTQLVVSGGETHL